MLSKAPRYRGGGDISACASSRYQAHFPSGKCGLGSRLGIGLGPSIIAESAKTQPRPRFLICFVCKNFVQLLIFFSSKNGVLNLPFSS